MSFIYFSLCAMLLLFSSVHASDVNHAKNNKRYQIVFSVAQLHALRPATFKTREEFRNWCMLCNIDPAVLRGQGPLGPE